MRDRIILVTGANSQIGSQIARNLITATDHRLVLFYHDKTSRIHDLTSDSRVLSVSCDLSNLAEVKSAVHQVFDQWKAYPDTLIHTATTRSYDARLLQDSDPLAWKHIFQSNVDFTFNLLHTLLPFMTINGFGRIVIFGSDVTRTGLVKGSAYAAAKSATINLVKTIAKEHGKDNVLVNAISPGPVETDLDSEFWGLSLDFRKEYFNHYLNSVPTGKLVSINEIYETVLLLTSETISGLNGQEVFVNGGLL